MAKDSTDLIDGCKGGVFIRLITRRVGAIVHPLDVHSVCTKATPLSLCAVRSVDVRNAVEGTLIDILLG